MFNLPSYIELNPNISLHLDRIKNHDVKIIFEYLLKLTPNKIPFIRANRARINFNRRDLYSDFYRAFTIEKRPYTIQIFFPKPINSNGLVESTLENLFRECDFSILNSRNCAYKIEDYRWTIIFDNYDKFKQLMTSGFFIQYFNFFDNLDNRFEKKYCSNLKSVPLT